MRLVAAAGGLALALVPGPVLAADPGSAFASYAMVANAPGLGISGLYRDVAFTVPETTSTLSTGGVGAGLASLAWPGPILGNLGTTILVLEDSAPPQVTALNDPVRAEARSGGTQTSTYDAVPGTVMSASATGDAVTASSKTASTLPIGSLGGFTGTSKTAFTGPGTAVGTARGVVTDLDLAGGVVHIGSLTSTAEATTDGTTSKGTASTVVGGMTVAGIPVSIDENGVHVQDTALPLAADAVEDAIAQTGLTILLTKPRTVREGGAVSVDAGALVVMYEDKAVTLGRASVGLSASRGGLLPTLPGIPLPPVPGTTAPGAAPVSGGVAPGLGSGAPEAAPQPAGPAPSVVQAVQSAAVDLARGASGLGVVGLLALGGLFAAAMRRLPDRVLAVTDAECEEWPA